jgi:hypothetical protein
MRRNRDAAMSHRNAPGICRRLSVDGFIFAARSPEIAGNLSLFPFFKGKMPMLALQAGAPVSAPFPCEHFVALFARDA